jgi:hypothetical protein
MALTGTSAFSVRLRDLLSTVETSALLGAAETRLRGLGEHLQFACLALPCDEALVALEVARLGRLQVPGVASPDQWRSTEHEFLPSGTPFAYLLGGGAAYAAELEPNDAMLEALRPVLHSEPRYGIFVPLRVGSSVVGGAALFRDAAALAAQGDDEAAPELALAMAERLAEVLALTLESFRTERVLLQLFAQVLPDLCAPDASTGFAAGLDQYVHELRLSPTYRRRLELAEVVGRIAAQGEAETQLVTDVLARVETYLAALVGEASEVELPPEFGDEPVG